MPYLQVRFDSFSSNGDYLELVVQSGSPLLCVDDVAFVQGLMRELYKAQGHSTTGPMDWDWHKFDSSAGPSRSESSSGGGVVTTGVPGNNGVVEATAGTALGAAPSTAAGGVTSRTQVSWSRGQRKLTSLSCGG